MSRTGFPIVVLKFGSSVLCGAHRLPVAVAEIYRHYREGNRVIAVVSAFEGVTDTLLKQALALTTDPDPAALAALVSTGEIASAAHLTLALKRAGLPGELVDPRDVDLLASGERANADPISVDLEGLKERLARSAVLVVPGFFGRSPEGGLALLGRGGSDLTALYLADVLAAKCILVKDVDGLYEADPALKVGNPRRFVLASYADAEKHAGPLIQPKALKWARQREIALEVTRAGGASRSRICEGPTILAPARAAPRIRVALLGLGTVGGGVFELLQQFSEDFEVVAALVREPRKHLQRGIPERLLVTSAESAFARRPDIVVEALPGTEPAQQCLDLALKGNLPVVTANKAVIASNWPHLASRLLGPRRQIRYSATVGGGVPMLEAVERVSRRTRIVRLRGVLNGTCNFVLDHCQTGATFATAIARAQALGFAESDPAEDLSGADSARKVEILGRVAFGEPAECEVVESLSEETVAALSGKHGSPVRLVAEAKKSEAGFVYRIRLIPLPPEDFLHDIRGVENRLEITGADGSVVRLTGSGAGRVPTAMAVFADLLDHSRVMQLDGMAGRGKA